MSDLTRLEKAVISIYDYATMPNATTKLVMKKMKADGFSAEEIAAAAEEMKR